MSTSAAAVQPEPWPASSLLRRTVAVVDMVGYSDIARILEENIGPAAVTELNRQIQEFMQRSLASLPKQGAYCIVAKTGDGIIILFDSANDAHAFATNVHLIASEHNTGRTEATAQRWFRVGIATGEVSATVRDSVPSEYAGTTIANAVRLEAAAKAGQVLVDASTYDAFGSEVRGLYGVEEWVKGKRTEQFRVHRLQVISRPEATAQSTRPGFRKRGILIGVASTLAAVLVVLLVQRSAPSFAPQHDPPAAAKAWYDQGLTALREGANTKATTALTMAIQAYPGYVMAHTRLAEAWAHLGFEGKAQQEMLIASSGEQQASPLERKYIRAIRANLTRDFQTSLGLYHEIVAMLPGGEKPFGYVDIGDAYEEVGDHAQALENYQVAAKLDPSMPAANIRIAQAEAALQHLEEAAVALDKVQSVFDAEQNMEGLAELDWERGYIAFQRADYSQATSHFTRAAEGARQIKDIQLEIRSDTELSACGYHQGQYPLAVEFAQKAINLATENMLEGWAAAGYVHLANAQYSQRHYVEADAAIQQALRTTEKGRQDAVGAMAKLTLASLRNLQNRPQDVLAPAEAALHYYQDHADLDEAFVARLMITRSQIALDNLKDASKSASELLDQATKIGNSGLLAQAQEIVGNIYEAQENFPAALLHYQAAWNAGAAGDTKYFEAEHCAYMSLVLGRSDDFEHFLSVIPSGTTPFADVAGLRLQSLMNRGQYRAAAFVSQSMLRSPNLSAESGYFLQSSLALAEAHLGQEKTALASMERAKELRLKVAAPREEAEDRMVEAEIELSVGNKQDAYNSAEKAYEFFSTHELHESAFRSAILAHAASEMLHRSDDSASSTKIDEQARKLREIWGADVFQVYWSSSPTLSAYTRGTNVL